MSGADKYVIEEIGVAQDSLVKEIVYQAIYVHKGDPKPTRSILNSRDLIKYYQQWGRKGDFGLMAVHQASEIPIGGAFVRYYRKDEAGYGFVAEAYPELNIAILPDHRSRGLGQKLLTTLLTRLKAQGCAGVSLSVDKRNPAFKLYQRLGFRQVRDQGNPTMLLHFS